jgi:hypothetical protein
VYVWLRRWYLPARLSSMPVSPAIHRDSQEWDSRLRRRGLGATSGGAAQGVGHARRLQLRRQVKRFHPSPRSLKETWSAFMPTPKGTTFLSSSRPTVEVVQTGVARVPHPALGHAFVVIRRPDELLSERDALLANLRQRARLTGRERNASC